MSLTLDPRECALVLIDMQKGILDRPVAPYGAAQIVENAVALGRKIKEAGGTVVLVNVAFANDSADRLKQEVDAPSPAPAGGMLRSGRSLFRRWLRCRRM
jgi:nicotinamidase-related amidase